MYLSMHMRRWEGRRDRPNHVGQETQRSSDCISHTLALDGEQHELSSERVRMEQSSWAAAQHNDTSHQQAELPALVFLRGHMRLRRPSRPSATVLAHSPLNPPASTPLTRLRQVPPPCQAAAAGG